MELRQLQYFLCLFEERSVTRAARRLSIVQPALSMQISKLEDELGQQLFVRSKQGMEPTPEGQRMYRLFLPILQELARARESMQARRGELTGQVRVGTIESIAHGLLLGSLLEFSPSHPKVNLTLVQGYSEDLMDAVATGELDAAIINKPRRSMALNCEVLRQEDLVLVAGMGHSDLAEPCALRELCGLKLVLPTPRHGLRMFLDSFARAEQIDLTPVIEVDSMSTIIGLVRATELVTVLPRTSVRRQLARRTLRAYNLVSPSITRELVCVSHPRRPMSPAAAAFIAILVAQVRGTSGQAEGETITAPDHAFSKN